MYVYTLLCWIQSQTKRVQLVLQYTYHINIYIYIYCYVLYMERPTERARERAGRRECHMCYILMEICKRYYILYYASNVSEFLSSLWHTLWVTHQANYIWCSVHHSLCNLVKHTTMTWITKDLALTHRQVSGQKKSRRFYLEQVS